MQLSALTSVLLLQAQSLVASANTILYPREEVTQENTIQKGARMEGATWWTFQLILGDRR